MNDLKPVECPLLPGVEPKVVGMDLGLHWVQAYGRSGLSVEGGCFENKAEAIRAWNEWMATVEVKRG